MTVSLRIPRILQQHSGGAQELRLPASTVRDLLEELERRFPALYQCICDETGAVRRHVSLFLNNDLMNDDTGFDKRLKAGDVVSVFQAVSGG